MQELKQILYNGRTGRNLLQKEVSELTGIPRTKISHYENGRQIPSLGNLRKLMQLYYGNQDITLQITHINQTKRAWNRSREQITRCRAM